MIFLIAATLSFVFTGMLLCCLYVSGKADREEVENEKKKCADTFQTDR